MSERPPNIGWMDLSSGKRLFLVGLVVSLTTTALIAIGILLFAEFGETTGRILATTGLIAAFSLLSLPAGALLDRGEARSLAFATIATAAVGLILTLVLLWGAIESQAATNSAVTMALCSGALAQAAATTSRLRETDSRTVRGLYVGAVTAGLGLAGMGSIAAWEDIGSSTYYRLLGALAVADLLLVLLQPAVRRMAGPGPARAAFRLVLTLDRAPSDEEVSAAVAALEHRGLRVESVERG
jgi:MFS family permease